MNLHITEGYLWLETNQQALSEVMLHTQYRGWWLCIAIHMAKVQYCICLTNMLQTDWKMLSGKRLTFWIPLLMEDIALLHSTVRSCSSHSVKLQAQTSVLQESACSKRAGVCDSSWKNKAYKQLHPKVEVQTSSYKSSLICDLEMQLCCFCTSYTHLEWQNGKFVNLFIFFAFLAEFVVK